MHFSLIFNGGERGIRTPEELAPLTVFKTAAFDHSAISPRLLGQKRWHINQLFDQLQEKFN
jgi:hypothetical protein